MILSVCDTLFTHISPSPLSILTNTTLSIPSTYSQAILQAYSPLLLKNQRYDYLVIVHPASELHRISDVNSLESSLQDAKQPDSR